MDNPTVKPDESLDTLMKRLESIVKILLEDSGTLESSLTHYEEGIRLAKECLKRLDAAEQHVIDLRSLLESDTNVATPSSKEITDF